MKDTELRGLVLQYYYDRRRENWLLPKPSDFNTPIGQDDILHICDQLGEHHLLDWKPLKAQGRILNGTAKITAFGIDVAEGVATPDIKVEFVQNKTINITGSSNVVVGNSNVQTISNSIHDLVKIIDSANATVQERQEAKGLLRTFLEHPLLAAIAGGAIGLLGK